MATLLTPQNADYVNAGESAVVTATLYDTSGDALNKAAVSTLTLTLVDDGRNVINSRDEQDVLDTNGGTLATDGTVTMILSPSDTAMVDGESDLERRYLQFAWTWSDGSNTLTGKEDFFVEIKNFQTSSASGVGWLG